MSPRTDDRLRYCTNSGSVPSKIYIPGRLKHLRTLDDEHTKCLYSPSVPIAFPQMQKPLSSVLSKRVYSHSLRMHIKFTQRKLASLTIRYVRYDTYEGKEKKEQKDESVVLTETSNDTEEKEVARLTYVNNIMHSIISNVEVYINSLPVYNSNGLYAHKPYSSNNFKAAISEYKGVLHCEGHVFEQDPEDISIPYLIPFSQAE